MKLSKLALLAAVACGISGTANAQQATDYFAGDVAQVGFFGGNSCDTCDPVCGCEEGCCEIGCDSSGCDGCGDGSSCLGQPGTFLGDGTLPDFSITGCGNCCLGDPWQLCGSHWGWDKGGWLQIGYHSAGRNGTNFNDHPDSLNLHQAWFYMEKVADGSCGFDWGGRVDYVYGVDAQNTQAFGLDNGHWDNDWDNGIYGHAIPQLYLEAAYGDWSVKAGHFYTIIGYEVVTAPDNFFYSHAFTMNNSEPFTHTGALVSGNIADGTTVYAGYTLGWDSGFEDNGDTYIGGISQDLTDDINVTAAYTGGRFNVAFTNAANVTQPESGHMFSIVSQAALTDNLNYILQFDYLTTDDNVANDSLRDTTSVNQYLIYNINDCWAVGARFEWWNVSGTNFAGLGNGAQQDIYDLTLGVNYRGNSNWIIRPEIRQTWDPDTQGAGTFGVNENNDDYQATFGIDGIFTY